MRGSYRYSEDAEMSIECNPDDLDAYSPRHPSGSLDLTGSVSGFSLSDDEDLTLMNRSHSAVRQSQAVQDAASAGFDNITVDLIYGIPGSDFRPAGEKIFFGHSNFP